MLAGGAIIGNTRAMERVIATYEPIADMGDSARDGFDRLVNETIASLGQAPEHDLIALEKQRLAVEHQLGRNFGAMLEGCAADCWLRPIIKVSDRKADGPSLKLVCLPNAPKSRPPLAEQERRCADAHAVARSEFDHYVAPQSTLQDFDS